MVLPFHLCPIVRAPSGTTARHHTCQLIFRPRLTVAVFSLPFALLSWLLVPKLEGSRAKVPLREKLAQFDLIGTFATTASMMMLILALTFGAAYGWGTAKFIVPFILTWVLLGFFFLWERRLPEGAALIPPKTWKLPNVALLTFVGIGVFQYWPVRRRVPRTSIRYEMRVWWTRY